MSEKVDKKEELPQELVDLHVAICQLPEENRQIIIPAFQKVIVSNRRRRRILDLVQEALSQLRLDMKYLVFDLEATHREKEELIRRLKEFEG